MTSVAPTIARAGLPTPGKEPQSERRDGGDWTGRVRPLVEIGTMRIADRHHRSRAGDQAACGERLPEASEQARDSGQQAEQGEGADAGNPRAFLHAAEVEAALDADQQAASDRGADRQRLRKETAVQRSRSACQRR